MLRDGGPLLIAADIGSGKWRFTPAYPANWIDPATVSVADGGLGTVKLESHTDAPQYRDLVLVSSDASGFVVQHGEQSAEDFEWIVDGVKTRNGVLFEAFSKHVLFA